MYLAKDVFEITGVKRNRLHVWIERGFISPSIQRANGTGTRNIWSKKDIKKIKKFRKLVELGYSRRLAATKI